MGGSVKVIIRQHDGTLIVGDRWTNTLGILDENPLFYHDDPKAVESYLEEYRKMAADYEANKQTGNFKYPMTDCYFYPGSDEIEPVEYGIVVFDQKARLVLSSQGYKSHGKLPSIDLSRHPNCICGDGGIDDETIRAFRQHINHFTVSPNSPTFFRDKRTNSTPGQKIYFNTAQDIIDQIGDDFVYLEFDLNGYQIERYEESNEGMVSLFNRLCELGYPVAHKREAFATFFYEEEEED